MLGAARDQGARPTCISFATSAAHEVALANDDYLAVEYLHHFAVVRSTGDFGRGATAPGIAVALEKDGQPPEHECPYGSLAKGCPPGTVHGPIHRRKLAFGGGTPDDVVQRLSVPRPSILVLRLTESFYKPDAEGRVIPGRADALVPSLHAVLAVGHGTDTSGPFVLIRNSWGAGWGLGGHAWIPISYLRKQLLLIGVLE
ncbi:C1 family peptidase [Anaeromyxobacter sp. PSR-1]|uniref:C1 family peptidase n=1 Tax=Anaeromyxobacter sp. PSR-1 TaxID=1300915 RepID=UPI00351BF5C2